MGSWGIMIMIGSWGILMGNNDSIIRTVWPATYSKSKKTNIRGCHSVTQCYKEHAMSHKICNSLIRHLDSHSAPLSSLLSFVCSWPRKYGALYVPHKLEMPPCCSQGRSVNSALPWTGWQVPAPQVLLSLNRALNRLEANVVLSVVCRLARCWFVFMLQCFSCLPDLPSFMGKHIFSPSQPQNRKVQCHVVASVCDKVGSWYQGEGKGVGLARG